MGLPSMRASLGAMALGVVIWLGALIVTPGGAAWVAILELFAALGIAYEVPALVNRRHWPVQPIFLWSRAESARLYPEGTGPNEDRIASVDALVSGGSGDPGSWAKVRALAADLQPPARREQILAMADLFETGEFHAAAFDAALAELADDGRRRYWRVRLAMTRAFAAYDVEQDCLPLLLDAATENGPFELTRGSRSRLVMARYLVGALFLGVGIVLAAVIAIAGSV